MNQEIFWVYHGFLSYGDLGVVLSLIPMLWPSGAAGPFVDRGIMFAKERPVSTLLRQGKRRATFKNPWDLCGTYVGTAFFFVSLKVGRCCWKSIISMNFHISTIQIGHGVGDLKWFATLIPWWWFQLDRATMVEFSDRNTEDFATGAPIFLCLWGTPSTHVISDNLWDFATNWYIHPQSKPLG